VKYIIVDEISMVTKVLWKLLVELKKATGITFILVGDHRQCQPVEDETIDDYFDHPAVKYLTNNNLCELTVMKRYNQELWDMLEKVQNICTRKFGRKICDRNLCFTNKTRKFVNDMLMRKYKPDDALLIPHLNYDDDKKPENKYTQDTWVYPGLPIIARKTEKISTADSQAMVNNEYFTVKEIVDNVATCVSIRANDDGEPTEHIVKCTLDGSFLEKFAPNYCSTTHKAQGETIIEDFTIWDWEKMTTKLKYTAMSRAKDPAQINFASICSYGQDYVGCEG
jgi:ATP-dependent exoDNAse (exonuclease V) alpha subunit